MFNENLSMLKVTGADSEGFLEAQSSNSVSVSAKGIYTSFLSPKAHIVALAYCIKESDQEFLLITHDAEKLKEHLEKFIILEDVQLEVLGPDGRTASSLRMTVLEEFQEGDTLIKLNLVDKYVSFSKGCFPGQEPLAKFKNIGMRKREQRSTKYTEEALEIFAQAENNEDSKLDEAAELLRKAIKENPKNEDAYESLGVILGRQTKYQEAIKVMHQLEMINSGNGMALMNLSIFYMKIGDKETAEEYKAKGTVLEFEKALQS